jgi:catechol 2,3-dioxygenase-like lactoylglutathione lyase family enzyme
MNATLTHIALHVRDIDASVAFYAEFCGMRVVHERTDHGVRVIWVAEQGNEKRFVIVLIEGGNAAPQAEHDVTHFGFALDSFEAVNEIARRGADRLIWPPTDLPYPVGHFCALRDPDGHVVEFSYGQPLGPGAPEEQLVTPRDT